MKRLRSSSAIRMTTCMNRICGQSCLLHCANEFPTGYACLDTSANYTHSELKPHLGFNTYIYHLPILVGIEVKYRKMGDRFDFAAAARDLKKLHTIPVPHPLVLAFIQEEKDVLPFLEAARDQWVIDDVTQLDGRYEMFVIGQKATFGIKGKAESITQ